MANLVHRPAANTSPVFSKEKEEVRRCACSDQDWSECDRTAVGLDFMESMLPSGNQGTRQLFSGF